MRLLKTPIPWLRVLIEGAVIVGSILLAFGIDAFWEARQERRAELLQLTALAEDFGQNVELLEEREALVKGIVRLQMKLLDTLRSVPVGSEVQIPDSLVVPLYLFGTIDPVRGTLDALIGSGRLDQLSDPALRYALTEWPRLVSDVRTDQLEALQYTMHDLIPFLATQGDYSQFFDISRFGDIDAPSILITMRSTPTLMTMIAGKYLMDQWIVFDIEPLVVKTREIHGLLLAELGR